LIGTGTARAPENLDRANGVKGDEVFPAQEGMPGKPLKRKAFRDRATE
jgi:hypothetical protein